MCANSFEAIPNKISDLIKKNHDEVGQLQSQQDETTRLIKTLREQIAMNNAGKTNASPATSYYHVPASVGGNPAYKAEESPSRRVPEAPKYAVQKQPGPAESARAANLGQ